MKIKKTAIKDGLLSRKSGLINLVVPKQVKNVLCAFVILLFGYEIV